MTRHYSAEDCERDEAKLLHPVWAPALQNTQGTMCGLCDSSTAHAHGRVKCPVCRREGLQENWPFPGCQEGTCNDSERVKVLPLPYPIAQSILAEARKLCASRQVNNQRLYFLAEMTGHSFYEIKQWALVKGLEAWWTIYRRNPKYARWHARMDDFDSQPRWPL